MRLRGLTMVLLALSLASVRAGSAKVATWNLAPNPGAGTNAATQAYQKNLVLEAASELAKVHPDVILLQGVDSWQECNQLAQALKPDKFNVALCSSFRDPLTQKVSHRQVAILSKNRPYISWTEPWQGGGVNEAMAGGFAFAAVRVGGKNAGFFSVQLGDGTAALVDATNLIDQQHTREAASLQLLRQISTLCGWATNRIEALVIGGDFNTSTGDAKVVREKTFSYLEEAGLENAFAGVPAERRFNWLGNGTRPDAAVEYVFIQGAVVSPNPQISPAALPEHWGATVELNLDAAKPLSPPHVAFPAPIPVKVAASSTNAIPMPAPVTVAVTPIAAPKSDRLTLWAGILTGVFALLAVVQWLSSRARSRRLRLMTPGRAQRILPSVSADRVLISASGSELMNAPVVRIEVAGVVMPTLPSGQTRPADPGAVQIPDAVQAGVIANLSRWMKEKLVRRLVSDRADLLATQQAATLKILAVDERLSKIERQIKSRNREYEDRIDELTKELAVAQEENRELIRTKIALVKAEMEKERMKAERFFKEHPQS